MQKLYEEDTLIQPDARQANPRPAIGPRMNFHIRALLIRVFRDGKPLGVMKTHEARKQAQEDGLDLVELVPNADPPVCHILDYGEYKYRESLKAKELKKKQKQLDDKELRFRPGIDDHDVETKLKQARQFIEEGRKVQFVLKMKGREMAHKEKGFEVITKIIELLKDIAQPESPPRMDGKTVACRLVPIKERKVK